MKKFVALCAALVLLFCMSAAVSAEAASDGVTVYVTLSDGAGHLVMARQPVAVTDLDADGSVTVNDALIAAHDEAYTGGSEAGYASVAGEYGLSITRLWGIENGGSYGYYVNNAMAMSLQDPVADGDRVSAYVYADLTAWSDMYCWFEPETASLKQGETVTLTLSGAGFDADWNPVTLPVEGAELTVNGERIQGKDKVKEYLEANPEAADKIEADIRANAHKLLTPQARKAAIAAGRAIDISADDFEG